MAGSIFTPASALDPRLALRQVDEEFARINDKLAGGSAGGVGPPGPTGPTGPAGDTGAAGAPGPPGPTAVSIDAGNVATLGTDGLLYVPKNFPVACAVTVSATQAIAANVPTKIGFDTVEFDTVGAFDVVNCRYRPPVEGYYQVNCGCGLVAGSVETYTSIYRNGVEYRRSTTGDSANARLSTLVYLNGSTDYIEGFVNSKSNFSTSTSMMLTSFSASLTQGAWTDMTDERNPLLSNRLPGQRGSDSFLL